MTTLPLDVDSLVGELEDPASAPFDGLPAGTVMGHVHLRVARIPETVAFYRDVMGFGLMAQLGSQAAFLAAGGYHHHLVRTPGRAPARRRRPLAPPPCGSDDRPRRRSEREPTPRTPRTERARGVGRRCRPVVHDPSGKRAPARGR